MKRNEALISVIIPVYNAQRFLNACISSVLAQTYERIEVLLIDDGSTDRSGAICDTFAGQDRRVQVIHQGNQGVSAARNLGIERSNGEFLCFVDADDIVHPQMLEMLAEGMLMKEKGLSVCFYETFDEELDEKSQAPAVKEPFVRLSRKEALAVLNEWRSIRSVAMLIPWAKLYERSMFEKLRFRLNVRHEDEFLAHFIVAEADNVYVTQQKLYFYRQHAGSFMNANPEDQRNHLILLDALTERIAFFEAEYPELLCGAVHHLLRECNSFYDVFADSGNQVLRLECGKIQKRYRNIYLRYFFRLDMHEIISGGLFSFVPWLYHCAAKMKFRG